MKTSMKTLLQTFLRLQQHEVAALDWQAGCVGILLRSVSLVKCRNPDHDALVEHSLFVVLALVIVVGSLVRSPLYVRGRTVIGLALRLSIICAGGYVYDAPLLQAKAGEGGGWQAGPLLIFKLAMTSRALPLGLVTFFFQQPLWLVALLQPASLALLAQRNTGMCAAAAAAQPHAADWFGGAVALLSSAAAVGAPSVRPAAGAECEALALWLQLSMGTLLPVLYLAKGEAQRFASFAARRRAPAGDATPNPAIAHAYRRLHAWVNGSEWATGRHAAVLGLLAASWIVIALAYS